MTHGQATFVEKGQVNTFKKYLRTSVPQAGSDSADILRKERWPEGAGGNQGKGDGTILGTKASKEGCRQDRDAA